MLDTLIRWWLKFSRSKKRHDEKYFTAKNDERGYQDQASTAKVLPFSQSIDQD